MHIASFAGFAPVNNPAISVAVVIDTPHGDYYGTSVSAPVFAEVAQQVLEYLGVPHDVELKPAAKNTKPEKPVKEDDTEEDDRDVQALYQTANDLPTDDPLRGAPVPAPGPSKPAATATATSTPSLLSPQPATSAPQTSSQTVAVTDPNKVRVPLLTGMPIRKVIEQTAAAGLQVQILGNGTCRQQAPDPGAMVTPNTKIIVRCGR
jgi:cell division protein FtsI (penicillin-binding protein 3)